MIEKNKSQGKFWYTGEAGTVSLILQKKMNMVSLTTLNLKHCQRTRKQMDTKLFLIYCFTFMDFTVYKQCKVLLKDTGNV